MTPRMARFTGLLLGFLMLGLAPDLLQAQLTWTPIYVGGESQIDLWTQSLTGCPCSFNSSSNACACCVGSGGCSCGAAMPNRCTQCGLENYCANMCNVTLDSRQLFSKSDRSFGQIKSPQLEGPSLCTYRFVPNAGQRVELQVWRMISIGRHNGTACEGGWLQFEGGARICGRDSRLQQPIVLFSDKPVPVLHMQINEKTERSQFYAFYSFTPSSNPTVGWPARGGKPLANTDCDWVYEEERCRGGCVLASPGYPGLYPPNKRCNYLFRATSNVSIHIAFTAVLMPQKHCTHNYIAVYAGTTTSNALLKTVCGNSKGSVVHVGKDILVEFRSGPEVDPFDYNGFVATLTFVEVTTQPPTTTVAEITGRPALVSPTSLSNSVQPAVQRQQHRHGGSGGACDLEVSGDRQRMDSYSTRGKAGSHAIHASCRFVLLGREYDTVHVTIVNYNVSMASCKSQVEVFDGLLENIPNTKQIGKICGPASEVQYHKTNSSTEHSERKRYSSSGRNMTIVLTRASDEDFMDVSYYFHNEREFGTQQPKTLCDVDYYGLSSPKNGTIHPKINRFQSHNSNVRCKQHFVPAANQAVIITLNSTMNQTHESQCATQCGDQGCRCSSERPLDQLDHLLLVSRAHGNTLACLCGNYRDWLPVRFWSTMPVYIEWSRSSHAGLNLTAGYEFTEDSFCGSHDATKLDGEIRTGQSKSFGYALNHYYQQKCTYVIDSPANREIYFMIESPQDRPCTAWNLTVHEYNKTNANSEGPRLATFCPRDIAKNFTISQDKRSVIVKLQALGRTVPEYTLRWRSLHASSKSPRNKNSLLDNNIAMISSSASGASSPIEPSLRLLLVLLLWPFLPCT